MNMWRMLLGITTLSIVCGIRPPDVSYADNDASVSQPSAVTAAEAKAVVAKEQAEAVREKAERAEQEAARAAAKATEEKQKSTRAQVNELQRELEALKAQETPREFVLTLGDVQFAPAQEKLTGQALRRLAPLVTLLKEQPARPIRIEGYADSRGEKVYNLDLSQRRADIVRDFLIANGIRAERITARGKGEANAKASNITAGGRKENRRVEIIVVQEGKRLATR